MPDTRIDTVLSTMRFAKDGRVTVDPRHGIEAIAARAGVHVDLVRALFRHRPVPAKHGNAELQKLLDHLLSGAAREGTPPEHHALLVRNAATLARLIDARRADEGQRADTIAPRAPASPRAQSIPSVQATLAPGAGVAPLPKARDAVPNAERTIELASAWLGLFQAELARVRDAPAAGRGAWADTKMEECQLHIAALTAIPADVRGETGKDLRVASYTLSRRCQDTVGIIQALQRRIYRLHTATHEGETLSKAGVVGLDLGAMVASECFEFVRRKDA